MKHNLINETSRAYFLLYMWNVSRFLIISTSMQCYILWPSKCPRPIAMAQNLICNTIASGWLNDSSIDSLLWPNPSTMPAYCYLLIPNQACFLLSNFKNAYSMQIPHWLPDNQLTSEIRYSLVFYRYRPYPPIRHSFVSHRTLPSHHPCHLWVISDPHSPFQLQNLTLISDILLSPPMSSLSMGNHWPLP